MKWLVLLVMTSTAAFAEAPWVSARGRLAPRPRLEVFAGPGSAGAGVVLLDRDSTSRGYSVEGGFRYFDRVLDLRGTRVWQVTPKRVATVSVLLGGSATFVPEGGFDVGICPHAGAVLALGGERFTVDLFVQTGAELFVRAPSIRFPQRVGLGLNLRVGDFGFSLMGRAGADVSTRGSFAGRAEAVLAVSWLGL